MTVSRNSAAAAALALVLALGAAHEAPALELAEGRAPIRLIPEDPGAKKLEQPGTVTPDEPSGVKPSEGEGGPGAGKASGGEGSDTGHSGIMEAPLDAPSDESAGVLDAASGGLGADLWRDLSRNRLSGLIVQLPDHPGSPPLRDLERRALLTRAVAPAGDVVGRNLVTLRLDRLLAMGALPDFRALALAIPPKLPGTGLAEVEIQGLFLAGDNDAACSAVRRHLQEGETQLLQLGLVVCQALGGDHDQADVGLALLRDQGARIPPPLIDLLQVLRGTRKGPVKSMPDPDGMQLALLAAAKRPVPADAVKSNSAAVLRAIAFAPFTPDDVRVAAAERAGAFGAVSPAELGEIYAKVKFPHFNANALAAARQSYSTLNRAQLYQAVRAEQAPDKRALLIQETLKLARDKDDYAPMAGVLAPIVAALPPDPSLLFFAGDAARALYVAGDPDHAVGWYRLLRDARDSSEAAIRLWPIAHLGSAGPNAVAWDAGVLENWKLVAERDLGAEAARDKLLRYYALLTGLGETQDHGDAWMRLIGSDAVARINAMTPSEYDALRLAAQTNRRGETVLLAVSTVGQAPLKELGLNGLRQVVASLRAVGLEREARAFALEAALASGL
ncbi:MAG TPA: hypothetical protein VMV26_12000 [Alphaproteobacteria bacterium]|nr:hypothetical protein [Alphaproteobacteria bacterium]